MFVSVFIEHSAMALNQAYTYASDADIAPGTRVKVPFGNTKLEGVAVGQAPQPDRPVKDILEILDPAPLLNEELLELAAWLSQTTVSSMSSCFKAMLPPVLKPGQKHDIVMEEWFERQDSQEPLTPRQQEALESIHLPAKAVWVRKEIKTIAKTLETKGYLVRTRRPKTYELVGTVEPDTPPELTEGQKQALDAIHAAKQDVILLHGVTGSGKTEVFLRLAQEALDQGRQVLFLVPEIGLTPMMISRVAARFGSDIAIYHSGLSVQEKYSQYALVRNGQARIVVGTRSACFLPFENLGLILLDEEHDSSYKQDSMPRYHARDVAIYRGKYHGCKVILSSATPSLESYARAYKGVYGLASMPQRVSKHMPDITFVNLQDERVIDGLSQTLLDNIAQRLARKEQVILLLNRRGYLPIVRCLDCKEVRVCPDCGLAMAYHKADNTLVCHCCGRTEPFQTRCPSCGSAYMAQTGMGTEKLEESLHRLFPQAKVVRMDADAVRKKNAHQMLLDQFETEGDILVGTQMVAKGLDFERVTLVGILSADSALARMDYRSAETAYAMLEQASGRAGRGRLPGQVIIQTFDQHHYVMESVAQHAYLKFFQEEMQWRRLGSYPPYVYMCTLVFSHEDNARLMAKAQEAKTMLAPLRVLGPAAISMRKGKNRLRLLVKDKDQAALEKGVWNVVNRLALKGVGLEVNMHPLMLEE